MQHLSPFSLHSCKNSPQALFMKATECPVNLTFEPVTPQSLVDRTKAVIIGESICIDIQYDLVEISTWIKFSPYFFCLLSLLGEIFILANRNSLQ